MTGRIFGIRLTAALSALFNALVLNLAMIVASLPLVTAPTAVSAASAALDRWARDGEDRVVRQFFAEFRARWSARVVLGVGGPLGALVLGGVEVRHFAREATLTGRAGLCLAWPVRRTIGSSDGGTATYLLEQPTSATRPF